MSGFPNKQMRSNDSLKLLNWGSEIVILMKFQKDVTTFELDTWCKE